MMSPQKRKENNIEYQFLEDVNMEWFSEEEIRNAEENQTEDQNTTKGVYLSNPEPVPEELIKQAFEESLRYQQQWDNVEYDINSITSSKEGELEDILESADDVLAATKNLIISSVLDENKNDGDDKKESREEGGVKWSDVIPDVDVELEAEVSFIKSKKIKSSDDERFLAEKKAKENYEKVKIFKEIVDEAQKQLEALPLIDERKVLEVCERCSIELTVPDTFEKCAEELCRVQNMYSEVSDIYEQVLPIYSVWKRKLDKLTKAYMTISSMSSDPTREGESYIYLNKLSEGECKVKSILDRVEISLKKLASIKDTISRVLTAMQLQYSAFGMIKSGSGGDSIDSGF